jgi:hypothetical protein
MMDLERFEALAGAYGGDIGRWPAGERAAASALAAPEPARTAAILSAEAGLDARLAAFAVRSPGAALVGAVLRSAETAGADASRRLWRWLTGAGVGVALAASAAGGVAVGAFLIPTEWSAALGLHGDPTEEASALISDSPDLAAEGS